MSTLSDKAIPNYGEVKKLVKQISEFEVLDTGSFDIIEDGSLSQYISNDIQIKAPIQQYTFNLTIENTGVIYSSPIYMCIPNFGTAYCMLESTFRICYNKDSSGETTGIDVYAAIETVQPSIITLIVDVSAYHGFSDGGSGTIDFYVKY